MERFLNFSWINNSKNLLTIAKQLKFSEMDLMILIKCVEKKGSSLLKEMILDNEKFHVNYTSNIFKKSNPLEILKLYWLGEKINFYDGQIKLPKLFELSMKNLFEEKNDSWGERRNNKKH